MCIPGKRWLEIPPWSADVCYILQRQICGVMIWRYRDLLGKSGVWHEGIPVELKCRILKGASPVLNEFSIHLPLGDNPGLKTLSLNDFGTFTWWTIFVRRGFFCEFYRHTLQKVPLCVETWPRCVLYSKWLNFKLICITSELVVLSAWMASRSAITKVGDLGSRLAQMSFTSKRFRIANPGTLNYYLHACKPTGESLRLLPWCWSL